MKPSSVNDNQLQEIPTWLAQPPNTTVPPPAVTRLQKLPLGALTWENFERLCLRLARLDSMVECCQLYGTRGQDQQGIDIFARANASYFVYQCKRVEKFSASDVVKAVDRFRNGVWFSRASKLFLCLKVDATPTGLAEEIEKQDTGLKKDDKELVSWDAERICEILKGHPTIVDDFFGRSWVAEFCGPDAAQKLATRLTVDESIDYRARLGEFYSGLFRKHDPGIPELPGDASKVLSLSERFVPLDVQISSKVHPDRWRDYQDPTEAVQKRGLALGNTHNSFANEKRDTDHATMETGVVETRLPVDTYLATKERIVVVGEPGSGKSTLLRAVTLSILGQLDGTVLQQTSVRWANLLPVWVPFPFWTKMIESGAKSSLVDCLQRWFQEYGQSELWHLVASALRDERLLLVVDGLDEWTTEGAARIGLERLQVFVEQVGAPVLLASRYYGIRRLSPQRHGWAVAKLASLTDEQRQIVCQKFYLGKNGDSGANRETETFLQEVQSRPDLDHLSRTPLFLLLLLSLNFRGAKLPTERFSALEQIIEHIANEHPASRRQAGGVIGPEMGLEVHEFVSSLESLAYEMHIGGSDAGVSETELRKTVMEFLMDSKLGLGLERSEARRIGTRFLEYSHTQVGLLIADASGTVRFMHRVVQEFLAGRHLSKRTTSDQIRLFREKCLDRRWMEIFLSLAWHRSDHNTLKQCLGILEERPATVTDSLYAKELSAELALGPFSADDPVVKEQSYKALEYVMSTDWLPSRRRVLRSVLDGIAMGAVTKEVEEKVVDWRFQRVPFQEYLLNGLENWPRSEETLELLFRALHTDSSSVQWKAGQLLGKIFAGSEAVSDRISRLIRETMSPHKRSALLGAHVTGWPEDPELPDAIRDAISTDCAELAITGFYCASVLGEPFELKHSDLDRILALAISARIGGATSSLWANLLSTAIATSHPSSQQFKERCLQAVKRDNHRERDPSGLNCDIALRILLKAYSGDPDVAHWCAEQLRERHPFTGFLSSDRFDIYHLIASSFREEPIIVDAIEKWEASPARWPELSILARAAKTPVVKKKLLAGLGERLSHWQANALVELWGVDDNEVRSSLTEFFSGPLEKASDLAYLIPDVFEPDAAKALLLEILRKNASFRPSLVIDGLAKCCGPQDESVVALVLEVTNATQGFFAQQAKVSLIRGFHRHPSVRDFARRALQEPDPPSGTIAAAYSSDDVVRAEVAKLFNPLPTSLRVQICQALARQRPEILSDFRTEYNEEVRVIAASEYYRSRKGMDSPADVEALTQDLLDRGPWIEGNGRTALIGLLALRSLEVFRDLKDPDDENKELCIDFPHGNRVPTYFRIIGQNWDYLREVLGSNPAARLVSFGKPEELWAELTPYATSSSHLRLSLNDYVARSSREPYFKRADKLRFHLSTGTNKQCIQVLIELAGPASMMGEIDDQHKLARIAARSFYGNPDLRDRLADEISEHESSFWFQREDGRLLILCSTWPKCDEVTRVYKDLISEFAKPRDQRSRMSQGAVWALEYSQAPAPQLPDLFARGVVYGERGFPGDLILRHLGFWATSRVNRDTEALQIFRNELVSGKLGATGKICVARLLHRAGDRSEVFLNWCLARLNDEARARSMCFGYDVFDRDIRSLATTLLGILDSQE